MQTARTNDGSCTILALSGKFDTIAASKFEPIVDELIAEDMDLILDFDGLEYISSAGMESIMRLYRSLGDRLSFRNVNGLVREELEAVRNILEG